MFDTPLGLAITVTAVLGLLLAVVSYMLFRTARARRAPLRVRPGEAPPLDSCRALLALGEAGADPRPRAAAPPETLECAALRELVAAGGDRAVRAAWALVALGEASPEERAQAGQRPLEPRVRPLSDKAWTTTLRYPGEDPVLTAMMALIGPEIATWHAHTAPEYGLDLSERLERTASPPLVASLIRPLSETLPVREPIVFVSPGRNTGLLHINLAVQGGWRAGVAVCREALELADETVMRFVLARKLTFMRPEHIVCTVADTARDLEAIVLAVSRVVEPGALSDPPALICGMAQADALGRLEEHLAAPGRRELMAEILAAYRQRIARGMWTEWLDAVRATATRAGLLLAGDLAPVIRFLRNEADPPTDRRAEQVCLAFVLSDDYAQLTREDA